MSNQPIMQLLSTFRERPLFGQSTHKGAAKKPNEDAYSAFSIAFGNEDSYVLAVADGVTSESGSQLASQLAIDTIQQTIKASIRRLPTSFSHNDIRSLLKQSILQADERIKDTARSHKSGMSTTIVAAFIIRDFLYIAHVGDSRAYLYRDRSLHLLTRDHTYVEEMIRQGKLTRKVAEQKTNRNVITRYLGPGPVPAVDLTLIPCEDVPEHRSSVNCISLRPGDIVLLCSDGLTSKVTEQEISRILRKEQHCLQRGTDQLIKKALEKQEPDNITAVLFRVPHQGESLLPGRGFLWLVGLFLFTLLFMFVISWPIPFFDSVQAPKLTETPGIAEKTKVGIMPSSQSPTPFPTPISSSTMTSAAANISIQSPTVTPVSAISPTTSIQNSTIDQSAVLNTVTPVTPNPTSTATTTPSPPPLQLEPQKVEIDVIEENGQYAVKFNPTSLPSLSKRLCVEVVVSTQEFVEEQKPSEGLGKCGKEKSFAKDILKPGTNYVSLWLYDLSEKKFLNLLSNQVSINIDSSDGSSDESTCITVDTETGECLDK